MLSLGLSVQLVILYVYTVLHETAMDERERLERNGARSDPVTAEDSAVMHYALKTVLMGLREARRIIGGVRDSDGTQGALASLERARCELDAFIRQED
jgi:hypothetical protein